MRIRTAVVLAALGLALALIAPQVAAADTALGESKWSLEIGTWLGSGSGDAAIAIRRHTGANTAWRFGIEADVSSLDGDGTRTETGLADQDALYFSDHHDYVLSLQWMHFAAVRDNLTATFGFGAFYSNYLSSYRQTYAVGQPSFYEYEDHDGQVTYGLDLGLGVEWFFSRRFSLGGQVGLRAGLGTDTATTIYREGTGATYEIRETTIESDITRVETSGGKILLSAYF